jgi:hypothetical protein
MNDEWKEYFGDRVYYQTNAGIMLIKHKDSTSPSPIECPVCDFLMRDLRDFISYDKYECCQDCAYKWAEPYRKKWQNGWRPDAVEIEEFIQSIMCQPTMMVR